jgi:hypothetical protein
VGNGDPDPEHEATAEPGDALEASGGLHSTNGESIMAASITRLEAVERETCAALSKALQGGKLNEASVLRRDYCSAVKSLHVGLSQQMRFDVERGKLIKLSRALEMITAALHEPLLLVKQLPELGCTPACKCKLETFAAALREAIRSGAAAGLRAAGGKG